MVLDPQAARDEEEGGSLENYFRPTPAEERLFTMQPWDPKPEKPHISPLDLLELVLKDPKAGYKEFLLLHRGPEWVNAGMKPGKEFDKRLAILVHNAKEMDKLNMTTKAGLGLGPSADYFRHD